MIKLLSLCLNFYLVYIVFMIEKNKELFVDNDLINKELENMMQRYQIIEDQNIVLSEENKRLI
jgi:hypothetical protein